jgi:HSP20 family molecular chaperone IbpA
MQHHSNDSGKTFSALNFNAGLAEISAPEIKETSTHFLVIVKAAHLKKEELKVEVRKNKTLVISELFSGYFKTLTLSKRVQGRKVKASYFGDVLQILLPKDPSSVSPSLLQ